MFFSLKRQFIFPECILNFKCIMSLFFEWWLSHRYSSESNQIFIIPIKDPKWSRSIYKQKLQLLYKIRTCTPYINATIMLNYTVMYNIIWQGHSVHNLHTFKYYNILHWKCIDLNQACQVKNNFIFKILLQKINDCDFEF